MARKTSILMLYVTSVLPVTFAEAQLVSQKYFTVRKLGPILMESTFLITGSPEDTVAGTAFVMYKTVSVDSSSVKTDSTLFSTHGLLTTRRDASVQRVVVTAKHLLEEIKGEYAYLVMRKKLGKQHITFTHKLKIREGDKKVWAEADEDVDIAVVALDLPHEDQFEFKILSENYLIEDSGIDEMELNAGDDLQCLGFPHKVYYTNSAFPILRSGKLASFYEKNHNAFLFDFQVYPGNSGGPVFVNLRTEINNRGEQISIQPAIVGVISGQIESSENNFKLQVAKVIPAKYILQAIRKLP